MINVCKCEDCGTVFFEEDALVGCLDTYAVSVDDFTMLCPKCEGDNITTLYHNMEELFYLDPKTMQVLDDMFLYALDIVGRDNSFLSYYVRGKFSGYTEALNDLNLMSMPCRFFFDSIITVWLAPSFVNEGHELLNLHQSNS